GSVSFAKTHSTAGVFGAGGADVLSLVVSGSVFVGVGGSFTAAGGIDTSAATGFAATGITLNYVSARSAAATYTAFSLHAASLDLVGVSGLDLHVTNLVVEHNAAAGASPISWGGLGLPVTLADTVTDTFSADF